MKIDIWSDVRCPFCYIGKKKFEAALNQFPEMEKVEIVWRSFQLDPNLNPEPNMKTLDYFVKTKNVSEEQARQMFSHAQNMAKEVDLDFDLENSIVANSLNAHRMIQFSKTKKLANEVEEALFKAHFLESKNIDDKESLLEIGVSAGLDKDELSQVLNSDDFSYEVKMDEMEARNIGVTGVPFFVFNQKYAVSGAQSTNTFTEVLEKAWDDFSQNQ